MFGRSSLSQAPNPLQIFQGIKASRCSFFQFFDHFQALCEFRYANRLTVADFLQRVLTHPSTHEFALCNLHDLG
jgi:hypothetical protein